MSLLRIGTKSEGVSHDLGNPAGVACKECFGFLAIFGSWKRNNYAEQLREESRGHFLFPSRAGVHDCRNMLAPMTESATLFISKENSDQRLSCSQSV